MGFNWQSKNFFSFLLSSLWAFSSFADVESLQVPYRKLLEKTIEVQSGKILPTQELIYQIPLSALNENSVQGPQEKAKIWNQENPLHNQPQILKELSAQLKNAGSEDLFNREGLKKNPVTLVVVPGIFGEFIDPLAFNEITGAQTSSLSRSFNQKMKDLSFAQGACKTGTESHCDFFFSLETMSLKQKMVSVASLDQLLSVSSIDDKDGNPLVKVILFKTPRMSLESMGQIKDIAAIFNRRLQKYFAIHGVPSKFAYVGYSRGTMVALEMLQQSKDTRAKGLFVVGGVTLGSDLADQVLVPGSAVNTQLAALKKLSDNLKLTHELGFLEAGKTRLANLQAWIQFAIEMAGVPGIQSLSLSEQVKAVQNFLNSQIEKGRNSDPQAIIGLAMSVAAKYGLIEQSPEFPYIQIKAALSHEDYSLNVARFKHFVDQATKAAIELTTQERTTWWSQAELPKNFTLYTFAATMADSKSQQTDELGLAKGQWASGPFHGADYLGLIENYRELRKVSGASMNDSQVAVAKVIGWPKVIRSLNPKLEIQTKFLALFGAHHWALALPVVNVNKDQLINPFPRSAFLESMAHVFSSQHILTN